MQISDENLIAYLMGDAEPELARQIEQQLSAGDLELVDRLNHLRFVLGQVDMLSGIYEPPSDLVESTMARIDDQDEADGLVEPRERQALSTTHESPRSRRSVWDSAVLTISLSVLCCLALPAIIRARFESRKNQCAENLRITGFDLFNFALNDPQGRFPYVSTEGPDSFAGVYAVRLQTAGFPVAPSQLRCASLSGCTQTQPTLVLNSIPNLTELQAIAWYELSAFQQAIGGDYAYNLGVIEDPTLESTALAVAPRYVGRAHFAILSDSPIFSDDGEQFSAHGGEGINIFYEDGHIAFISAPQVLQTHSGPSAKGPLAPHSLESKSASYAPRDYVKPALLGIDHPFRNMEGVHGYGLTPNDASLAPSYFSPRR